MSDDETERPDEASLVVVPARPGPVTVLASSSARERDDLDELIDDFFPDVEGGPGAFDVVLGVVGVGLLAWAIFAEGPTAALVVGAIALGLGCVLPLRSAWRRVRRVRRDRGMTRLLNAGIPLNLSSDLSSRLVASHENVVGLVAAADPEIGFPALAATHGALVEVASLLRGRVPMSDEEMDYVSARVDAVTALEHELVAHFRAAAPEGAQPDTDAAYLLEARKELEALTPFNSVTQVDDVIADLRARRNE